MIPKIIHQTWKTKELPENLNHWHNLTKTMHPGWEVRLWTDEDNLQLVKKHFPHMLDIYQAVEYNIMRADIIRYMYMAVFGGYYLDLDYELLLPFDDSTSATELLLPVSQKKFGKPVLGNCIFGSAGSHVFWKDVLNDLYEAPPIKKIYNKHSIIKLTGPEFLTRIYYNDPKKYKGTLSPTHIFHPRNEISKVAGYQNILIQKGSRGIHHCVDSWRATTNPLVFISTKINSLILRLS